MAIWRAMVDEDDGVPADAGRLLPDSIRLAREERGWTQREMARRIAITPQTVSGWERGKTIPRFERLEKLAAVLGMPPTRFVETARDQAARRRALRLGPVVERIERVMRDLSRPLP